MLIEPCKVEKEEQPTVLLPEGYKLTSNEPYTSAKVVEVSGDCQSEFLTLKGKTIIVDTSMVQEININNSVFHLVLENYVLGIFG